jgi:hypothetical protein
MKDAQNKFSRRPSRKTTLILAVLVLLAGLSILLSLVGNAVTFVFPFVWLFCFFVFSYLMNTLFSTPTYNRLSKQPDKSPLIIQDSNGGEVVIQPHAWEAMRAVNVTPNTESPAMITNIGMLALWSKQTVFLYHSHAIPHTAEALQPFIEIHFSRMQKWKVAFEIRNHENDRVFYHEINQFFGAATRLLIPPASLPLHNLSHREWWTLHVWLNGSPLAKHTFRWRTDTIQNLDGRIESDGEIDGSTLALLADNYAKPLSLDD